MLVTDDDALSRLSLKRQTETSTLLAGIDGVFGNEFVWGPASNALWVIYAVLSAGFVPARTRSVSCSRFRQRERGLGLLQTRCRRQSE